MIRPAWIQMSKLKTPMLAIMIPGKAMQGMKDLTNSSINKKALVICMTNLEKCSIKGLERKRCKSKAPMLNWTSTLNSWSVSRELRRL